MSPQDRRALIALRVSVGISLLAAFFTLYVLDSEAGFFAVMGIGILVAILLRLTVFR